MRVILGSDESTELTRAVRRDLEHRGHTVTVVGPPAGEDLAWAAVGRKVGQGVACGDADNGVLFCWTGTGASIAANKVAGVRAALCLDAQTAEGARRWNDANALALSLRATSEAELAEILDAWFAAGPSSDADDRANVEHLDDIERS
jgi:ribose 5-phosphate isomerase B